MDQESRRMSSLAVWLAGAALGAAAMYITDPERGRRRRALAADKMRSLAHRTGNAMGVAQRDLGNRMQGMRAQTRRMLARGAHTDDDDALAARVRREIACAVAHPRAVKIDVHEGGVTLHGAVLAHEKQELLDCVRAVSGVAAIDDRLDVHESAAGVPSLQGDGKRHHRRHAHLRESWPPALRAVATLGGSALGLLGLARGSMPGYAAAALGLGLAARGIGNRPLMRMRPASAQGIELETSIYIDAPPETVFDVWSRYENFPRFMSHVKEVRETGEGRSHWVVSGPAGTEVEWDAVTTEARRPEMLAWRTEPDTPVQHAGAVHFEPSGDGVRVTVRLSYQPPAGIVGHAAAALFNGDPRRQMEDDLMRMKSFIESGFPPHRMQPPEQEMDTAAP